MAQGTIIPSPKFTALDNNGDRMPGAKLYSYVAGGTVTPLSTYSDATLQTANANPVVMDAGGRATVFLLPRAYCFQLRDASDVVVWTVDGVVASAPYSVDSAIDGIAGETLAANSVAYLSDGTGGRTAGRWYLADADTAAYSIGPVSIGMVPSQILIGATGSIRIGGRAENLSGLTAGTTYYVSATSGALTSSAPGNARIVGVADSTTSLVLADSTGPVPASRVSAGTFGAGSYAITGDLTVDTTTLKVDATNNRVGIGTASPAQSLDVQHATAAIASITGAATDGAGGYAALYLGNGSNGAAIGHNNAGQFVVNIANGADVITNAAFNAVIVDSNTGAVALPLRGLHVGGTSDAGDNNLLVDGTTTTTGATRVSDGAVATPSITFTSDTDTGIYRDGSNQIGIASGGANALLISSGLAYFPGQITVVGNMTVGGSEVEFTNLGASTGTDLIVDGFGVVHKLSSSRRYKEHEQPWTGDPRCVLALVPKTFDYKGDGAKGVLFFIAEEVAAIDPIFVNPNAEGQPESIRTDALVAALVALVQQQDRRLAALEAKA